VAGNDEHHDADGDDRQAEARCRVEPVEPVARGRHELGPHHHALGGGPGVLGAAAWLYLPAVPAGARTAAASSTGAA
jgi:hypothetical protein